MPPPKPTMTAEDYWNLPDSERAELIDGELWDLAAPSRAHQYIQGQLVSHIDAFIKAHSGSCQVYPAPLFYPFNAPAPVDIFPGLELNLAEIVADM